MNILIDALPKSVSISGEEYAIHTNFRDWIRLELTLSGQATNEDKMLALFKMFCSALPPTKELAVEGVMEFFSGMKEAETGTGNTKPQKRIYSFEHDAEYIYSAFLSQYNIDLNEMDMHWWKFKALFKGLDDTHKISKIMEFRAVELTKIKDKEQKSYYRRMKELYRLPDGRTESDKADDFVNALSGLV